MFQAIFDSTPAENAKWRKKNNESEIGSNEIAASFHHVSLIATHIETLNS